MNLRHNLGIILIAVPFLALATFVFATKDLEGLLYTFGLPLICGGIIFSGVFLLISKSNVVTIVLNGHEFTTTVASKQDELALVEQLSNAGIEVK